MTRLVSALAVVAVVLLAPVDLAAQVADAVIDIVATDESGAALPGVTVVVNRPDTGFSQTAVTDVTGLAHLVGMQPGIYDVRLELAGFGTVIEKGITIRVGQTARIAATLKVAQVAETVNVVAQATLVDVFKTDSSTNIVPEQIQQLPVPDRDFQKLAFLAPGVQRERGGNRFIGNAPVIGAAGNASQATIMVDGVDFTDPVLGLARARFSQEAIGEFRVIANRFDPEIGGSAGGALSIVTKSGTNTMAGSAFGFFRDEALRRKGALDLQKNPYSRQQFGGTIGGPVARDRTHYFAAFEQVAEDTIVAFRPGGAYASHAADLPFPFDQSLLSGGLDHQLSAHQTLRARVVYEHARQQNFRTGGVGDLSSGMNLNRNNFNATATHSATLAGGGLNQLSVQVRPPPVHRAEQLAGDRRVFFERQHAADRRQSGGRSERYQRHLRGAKHVLQTDRLGPLDAGPEGGRRRSSTCATSGTSPSIRTTC